ncbi:MAG: outer membrane protein assembly factor BamA [Gammaproteobacteria bacterium]|nr:outer membrane protein assembly factor BamA [Gammaproteobacteria bacterium]MBT7932815.1 outer membrane protein assembly factor BamA [Gammaproteobacteria bacterium]
MMIRVLLISLIYLVPSSFMNAYAAEEDSAESMLISNIIINGNKRVTNDTILSYSNVSEGDLFSPDLVKKIIKDLYKTGYFDDISVSLKFNDLIINVNEKPIISAITITDNAIIEDEDILKALEDVGISTTRPYDRNIFDKIQQELVRLYFDRGRYNADISTTITNLERNRVSIELTVNEGDPSSIREINIVGNKAFSKEKILGIMKSGTKYFFEFWSSKDTYSSSILKSDITKIENYYLNRGFVRFRILSNQVNLSNDNKDIIITINIEEGERYEFGDIKLYGNAVVDPAIIRKNIKEVILPKQTFSRQKLQESEELIGYLLGDEGYAFPEISSLPLIDDATKIVDIEFRVDPGQRSTVRRINIVGNDNTNDEVYRRELRQFESAIHSNKNIERSKVRLQRLKYVENVNVIKTKVSNTSDLVDVTFEITERKSGEFKVSAGWSDTDGAIFDINLQQDNFLGYGKNVGLKASKSSINTALQFLLTDPYYTFDGVARTLSATISQTDVSGSSTASYLSDTLAAGVMYNMPISETATFGIGYDVSLTEFTTTIGSPVIVRHHITDHGRTSLGITFKADYTSDTRNRTIFAETGILSTLSGNLFMGFDGASHTSFTHRSELNKGHVLKTFGFDWNTVFQLKTTVGIGFGLGSATSLPFYNKYFAGGNTTVRGYKGSTLGPLTYNAARGPLTCAAQSVPGTFIKCDAIGGDFLTAAQFNWVFAPPPFLGEDTRALRTTLFFDIGNVFEKVNNFDYNELRASYGIEFNVLTPIGGVSVGFVSAINDKEGDDVQPVIFQLGGAF